MTLDAPALLNRLASTQTLVQTAAALSDGEGELRARELLRRARGYLRVMLADLGAALDEPEADDGAGSMADVLAKFRDGAKAGTFAGVFVVGLHRNRGADSEFVAETPAAQERLYGVLAARCFQGLGTR